MNIKNSLMLSIPYCLDDENNYIQYYSFFSKSGFKIISGYVIGKTTFECISEIARIAKKHLGEDAAVLPDNAIWPFNELVSANSEDADNKENSDVE